MGVIRNKQNKQATIYITATAMETVKAVHGLDEGERDLLNSKPETQLSNKEGYYLASESMRLSVLPVDAEAVRHLSPCSMDTYAQHVSYPPELRGVIFSGAPNLPEDYAAIIGYWSPLRVTPQHDGAQHCQNLLNEYEVDASTDVLISNGIVVCISGVTELIAGADPSQFLQVDIPVDADMLGIDRDKFDSEEPYGVSVGLPCEHIYLKVADILASPNPDFIVIAVLHTEYWSVDYCE
jgi:hypothetical protein